MSYTDPSGYFFKKLWQATTGKILRAIAKVPILNAAAQFAACAVDYGISKVNSKFGSSRTQDDT